MPDVRVNTFNMNYNFMSAKKWPTFNPIKLFYNKDL